MQKVDPKEMHWSRISKKSLCLWRSIYWMMQNSDWVNPRPVFEYNRPYLLRNNFLRIRKRVKPTKTRPRNDYINCRGKWMVGGRMDRRDWLIWSFGCHRKLDWVDEETGKKAEKFNKIVILKNMYTQQELDVSWDNMRACASLLYKWSIVYESFILLYRKIQLYCWN